MPNLRVILCASIVLVCFLAPSFCGAELVFMLPSEYDFSVRNFGITTEELLADALRVYNYSDLIVSVPDDWKHRKTVEDYMLQERNAHERRAKRDGATEEPLQTVHLHRNKKQKWIHDQIFGDNTNFTDEVGDYIETLSESTTNSWGLDRIDQTQLTPSKPLDGNYLGFEAGVSDVRTVHFYVIDTGVAQHPAIPQTISYDFSYYPDNPADCNGASIRSLLAYLTRFSSGHGTHVAGIAMSVGMGVSPGTRHIIHSIQVLDCLGMGDTTGVLAGLSWVKDNFQSPAVINLSIGIKGISSTLSTMIKSMRALGIVIVGAAGNQGDNACLYFPAGITASNDVPVVGVGALAQPTGLSDVAASFSNYGSCVRIYAPGDMILSTLPGGLTGKKRGTSMASPFLAGAIILALATTPSLSAVEAQSLVLARATIGTVTGANVFSGTNNVLWVPPALSQPTVPPALATTSVSVSTSTTNAATTNAVIASTTGAARSASLTATTSNAAASTRAAASTLSTTGSSSSTTTARATSTRAATTASTSIRASTSRTTTAATTTARASTSATTTARATSTRSASTVSTSTRSASTRAASTASTSTRSASTRSTSTRATSTRSASTASTSTRSTSTRSTSTRATSTRSASTASTSTRSTSTRATSTASTSRAASTRAATTTGRTSRV